MQLIKLLPLIIILLWKFLVLRLSFSPMKGSSAANFNTLRLMRCERFFILLFCCFLFPSNPLTNPSSYACHILFLPLVYLSFLHLPPPEPFSTWSLQMRACRSSLYRKTGDEEAPSKRCVKFRIRKRYTNGVEGGIIKFLPNPRINNAHVSHSKHRIERGREKNCIIPSKNREGPNRTSLL